jgi:hypothetical protein
MTHEDDDDDKGGVYWSLSQEFCLTGNTGEEGQSTCLYQ